ncbi:hypothetical protein A3J15_03225 [Candidatus Roizmanbacteria bacterium RIFCSPLOWO2_02_FULL_38_10]|uniref:Transport permease protein n=1 Tax=Candidatus Roizmanbacteria bacterium RIFCSPLOWO2_02_FULL_38_10 TaxID=1802074 RepID=A0A1F7JL39_9BACT|nr:MAG: hypothetical protein A3J15_03225 [Candidatus Roizmanbacteria bacterium RIFCSPLOWO2_02_FULL_38_10]
MTFIKYWSLLKHLTSREIKARYKQSFLGFLWIVLNPFCQMLIMSFVFSHILRISNLGVPYPIFIYAGLLPWIFFQNSLSNAMSNLVENASLVKKVYFPREILILSTLLAKVFDFFLSATVFILLLLYFQVKVSALWPLFLVIFAIQFLFTYGLSLLLSLGNLFYRDVQYLFNLVLTVWFYLTPVLYATEFFPVRYRWIFKFNPMSVFINAYREVILSQGQINWGSLGIGLLLAVVVYVVSFTIFKKMEGTFADVV